MYTPEYKYGEELRATANALVAPGKGILAADESTGTIGKRLATIGVDNTHENRVAYRELLFTAEGLSDCISGVILYDETFNDTTADGQKPLVGLLQEQGVIPGIKVDKGSKPMALTDHEFATEGLDGLPARCAAYYQGGARFAKWRAVLTIAEGRPSDNNVVEQCHTLARYAAICQANGLVPIVEPEVLMDGAHDSGACQAATERVQAELFRALVRQRVLLEGLLLKPNMVLPGASSGQTLPATEVARRTLQGLSRAVPSAVPGIVFLSGGQTEAEAAANLNAMAASGAAPWVLSFSFGRALQQSCLQAWRGQPANVPAAQAAFMKRARANSLAQKGEYMTAFES